LEVIKKPAQCKQSANGRIKFAQSGHPVCLPPSFLSVLHSLAIFHANPATTCLIAATLDRDGKNNFGAKNQKPTKKWMPKICDANSPEKRFTSNSKLMKNPPPVSGRSYLQREPVVTREGICSVIE
jgi:hypothetical protein